MPFQEPPRFGSHPSWRDFFAGFTLPFSAARLILRSPLLLGLSALCSVVTLASLVFLVWGGVHWTGPLLARVIAPPQHWALLALWRVLEVLVFVALLFAGINTVPLLVLSPLQEPLSRATERALVPGDGRKPAWLKTALLTLGHTALRVILLWGGHALLLLLNLIPGAGHAAWLAASVLWTMAWLAVEYLDVPMTRNRHPFAHVRHVVLDRLALCLGFGSALYVLLWVPVVNLFLIPLAVVSGTLLFLGLEGAGALLEAAPAGG